MNRFNFLFATLLLACLVLSFVAPNNLDEKQVLPSANIAGNAPAIQMDMDTVSREELQKFVSEKLIEPITKCMEKHDPHLFMTKCYSRLEFEISTIRQTGALYIDTPIKGTLAFIDCSREIKMADVTVNYKTKEIKLKESFKTPPQDLKTYLNDICKYIDKNGVPKE